MIDYTACSNELTDAFIQYQYRLEYPMPNPKETKEDMLRLYRSNAYFHAKVDSLVSGVMHIVSKYINE